MFDLKDSQAISVTFTRLGVDRDRVEVHRADGSVVSWEFPTHVFRLPHDLCHLIVEEGLGIRLGLWGLVSRGVDVWVVDDRTELMLDGSPLRTRPGVDFSDLRHSEEAVACLSPSGLKTKRVGALQMVTLTRGTPASDLTQDDIDRIVTLFPGVEPDRVRTVRSRLVAFDQRWTAAAIGDSVTLRFSASSE